MDQLKVAVAMGDASGVAAYRLRWPSEAVAEKTGWDVRAYRPEEISVAEQPGKYLVKGLDLEGLDLFVMSRPPSPKHLRIIAQLQRIGVSVVVDMDDDLTRVHPDSSSWVNWNGKRTHWRNAVAACESADLVTCSTKAIERRFARHGRYAILNNRMPDALTLPEVQPEDGPFTVLWSGSARGHAGDLEATGAALRQIDDVRVRVVGPEDHVAERLGLREDQVTGTGWVPFDKWHQVVVEESQKADVGIVPLGLTRFNQAKSWLKGMEFLNVGLPVIASPTAEYVRLAKETPAGVRIAKTPAEWEAAVKDAQARSALDTRQTVRKEVQDLFEASRRHLVMSEGVDGWIDAWTRAATRRKRLKR